MIFFLRILQLNSQTKIKVSDLKSSNITDVTINDAGSSYKVGDKLNFNDLTVNVVTIFAWSSERKNHPKNKIIIVASPNNKNLLLWIDFSSADLDLSIFKSFNKSSFSAMIF